MPDHLQLEGFGKLGTVSNQQLRGWNEYRNLHTDSDCIFRVASKILNAGRCNHSTPKNQYFLLSHFDVY